MKSTIITIGSITMAQKAKKLLSGGGFRAKIVKLNTAKFGCGYGITIDNYSTLAVARILRAANITYSVQDVDVK